MTALAFAERLLTEYQVAVVPGDVFGSGVMGIFEPVLRLILMT